MSALRPNENFWDGRELAFGESSAIVDLVNADQRMLIKVYHRGGSLPGMLLLAGLFGCFAGNGRAAETLPEASEVTRRMIERAQAVAEAEQGPQYTYQKRSVLERLDAAGQPVKSEEKLHQVILIRGLPFNRLVKVQGRELNAEELKREEAREERFQQRFVSADRRKLAAQKAALVTPELLDRYQFAVKERVVLSNRPTLVLTFKPKDTNLPERKVQDKLLNRMAGTLWVDEADADTARVVASLVEPLSLGFLGWLGSLTRCELSLERQRMPDGVWINTRMTLLMHCRRLTAALRFRLIEESRGFRRVEARR
jgi:hypothetical protein